MTHIHLLTTRHRIASPQYGILLELETILASCADVQLVCPLARQVYRRSTTASPLVRTITQKTLRRSIGLFHPIPEVDLPPAKGDVNVLLILGLNGSDLEALAAIPRWRRRYDLVVAYLFDCWVVEALPRIAAQIDHLFIPFPEMQAVLEARLGLPVSLLPFGADVLGQGSARLDRPVDVISYGRNPLAYHQTLVTSFGQPGSNRLYYTHPTAQTEVFPTLPYGPERFDYQHRLLLGKMLRRSKAALAFSNTYTAQVPSTVTPHVAHRVPVPILGYRWFEISATGCAVIGKRPKSPLLAEYLGWEDATIELPDDPRLGVDFIGNLLGDTDRMAAIHQRNYRENLIRNDWRHRLRMMFERLALPLPPRLKNQLGEIERRYAAAQMPGTADSGLPE
ncbi:MAG: glycosyltransferase [Nodosilinea sp.]